VPSFEGKLSAESKGWTGSQGAGFDLAIRGSGGHRIGRIAGLKLNKKSKQVEMSKKMKKGEEKGTIQFRQKFQTWGGFMIKDVLLLNTPPRNSRREGHAKSIPQGIKEGRQHADNSRSNPRYARESAAFG